MDKLRIGFLLNSDEITAWGESIIKQLMDFPFIELSLIIKRKPSNKKNSLLSKVNRNKNNLSWILYEKLDAKVFKVSPDALESRDIKELLPNTPSITVSPKETKFSDRILRKDIDKIKSYNVDLLVRFGFRILRGKILTVAKYGVWSYHHGDARVNRGGPPGYWELAENVENTGATLQILSEDLDGGKVLAKCISSTDSLSLNRNKNTLYWNAASMLPTQIKRLFELGEKKYFSEIDNKNLHPSFYSNRLYTRPRNLKTALNFLGLLQKKMLYKGWRLFNFEQWVLLYQFSKKEEISKSFFRFKKLIPPKDRFWADPFIVLKNEKYYVFIEELIYKEGIGYISVMELKTNGELSQPIPIIKEKYHLSYPFVFENNGEFFMIPESKKNKSIDLYKCTSFPFEWKKERTLMKNIEAVDTTLLFHNGLWWMFLNVTPYKGVSSNDQLHLFYSESFKSKDWTPHPMNPIVHDVSKSRPAGKIFKYKDKLYRPSQNCSKRYGHGIKINCIEVINKEEYRETEKQDILPNWDDRILGVHTINQSKNITVIDALHKRSRFS